MLIVLARHGQAEHAFGKADRERILTKEGRADVRSKSLRLAAELTPYLKDGAGLYCLTSPAKRAKETAEIICQTLTEELGRALSPQVDSSIYMGSVDLVEDYLKDLDPEACLILVGHQPSVSYWSADLSGEIVYFHTGDMAGFLMAKAELEAGQVAFELH